MLQNVYAFSVSAYIAVGSIGFPAQGSSFFGVSVQQIRYSGRGRVHVVREHARTHARTYVLVRYEFARELGGNNLCNGLS